MYHGDVMGDTISVAVEDGSVVGVCFLMETSSYRARDPKYPGYLNMEYAALSDENEVKNSELLIETLIDEYHRIREEKKDGRLILRTFCSSASFDYLDFLSSFGFRAESFMFRMRKELGRAPAKDSDGSFSFEVGLPDRSMETISVSAVKAGSDGSMSGMEGYFEANGRAFGIPDSEPDLLYKMREQNGIQFIARSGSVIVAAVSVWENNPGSVSTENIFCEEKYRRLGITEKLLSGVLDCLSGIGYREATLFVYGVNTYAVALYTKLGYSIYGGILHMNYEDGYVPELV